MARKPARPDSSDSGPDLDPDRTLETGTVILIPSDRLGSGPEDLGSILMRSFLKTLRDSGTHPRRIVLINSGVRMAVEGSDLIDDLRVLQDSGIDILCCGTCLDFFHSREKLKAGRVSNMREIVDVLTTAGRVIRV